MKSIAIFGAGSVGREILVLIRQINLVFPSWDVVGFFDDNETKDTVIHNLPVLGGIEELNNFTQPLNVVIAIGEPKNKECAYQSITNPLVSFPCIIHPSIQIDDFQNIELSEGVVIQSGSILTCDIKLGKFVFINLSTTIGHDCVFEDFVSIMPGCNISGYVTVKKGVYIGTGAKLIKQITINEYCVIGAGAVVNKDIPKNSRVVGVPAKHFI